MDEKKSENIGSNTQLIQPEEDDIMNEMRDMYIVSIKWYIVYMLYGTMGGILFNLMTKHEPIICFDLMFNGMISPIIYYNSPRHILMKITKNQFILIYTPSFIAGLCFRFLDLIPNINTFEINPLTIDSPVEITMACIVALLIIGIVIYYIVWSQFPIINTILFILYITATLLSSYYFYILGGTIHYHHYSVGLMVMLLSRNYRSKIVIMIHAVSYGVYIDGISRWGYAPIYTLKM
jgi:hypothetical protein